jgi:hypothetical protein
MGLTIVFVILAVFLVVYGVLKIRVAAHASRGALGHVVLAALAIGLAVWPIVEVVQFFGACSCG